MAREKNIEKTVQSLKENLENVVARIKSNPQDLDDFLSSKTLGLTIEIYPDDTNYNCEKVLENIVKECKERDCLYAYILHDNDFYTENTFDNNKRIIGKKGEKKKDHYHIVIQFNYPSVIGDFVNKLGLDDEEKFCRFIKKLKKPIEIDNMLLYLSHIKYPNKHQYHKNGDITEYIKSNRIEYVNYIHLTYHPKSAIKYAIKLTQEHTGRYIRKADVFLACDEAEIGYDDYLKAYRVVKDIVDEHNKALEIVDPNLEQAYIKMVHNLNNEMQTAQLNDKKIRELAETFGCVNVEFDGKEMMVVNIPEKKRLFDKPLEEEKSIDMLKELRK